MPWNNFIANKSQIIPKWRISQTALNRSFASRSWTKFPPEIEARAVRAPLPRWPIRTLCIQWRLAVITNGRVVLMWRHLPPANEKWDRGYIVLSASSIVPFRLGQSTRACCQGKNLWKWRFSVKSLRKKYKQRCKIVQQSRCNAWQTLSQGYEPKRARYKQWSVGQLPAVRSHMVAARHMFRRKRKPRGRFEGPNRSENVRLVQRYGWIY